NDVTSSGGITGVNIHMGSYDTTTQRRNTFNGSGGTIQNYHEISTLPNYGFDQGNSLANLFRVVDGTPITGTGFISNNMATIFHFEDDMDSGFLNIGASGMGFVGQIGVAAGKQADLVNFAIGGCSIMDAPGLG